MTTHYHPEESDRRRNPVDVHVGGRVRSLRMLKGMSQEELAGHLSLTFQQVQKYERGSNRISAGRLFQIARVFGVSVSALYDGLEDADGNEAGESTNTVLDLSTTRDGADIIRAFAEAPPAHRRIILDVAKSLAELPH